MPDKYASRADYEVCRRIHRQFGTTYYFATKFFPPQIQQRVNAVYAFVRIPDEWVDNPQGRSETERRDLIEDWRNQYCEGIAGRCPEHPAMRAFVDAARESNIPEKEVFAFLDAMATDIWKTRYETYEDLREYMRGSASAVGVMMCYAMGATPDDYTIARAYALGEAMQLTNFIRDVSEDIDRGRIYLPIEDLASHGIREEAILAKKFSPEFRELIRFEVCRAKQLYYHSDQGLPLLPHRAQSAVMVARLLYAEILDEIEGQGYDVFLKRARTKKSRKLSCAIQVLLRRNTLLKKMTAVPKF